MSGSMTMTAVIEEKNSKVIEVILSSVSSKELMTGKVFGNSITSLVQMVIWLIPNDCYNCQRHGVSCLPDLKFDIRLWTFYLFFIQFFSGFAYIPGLIRHGWVNV